METEGDVQRLSASRRTERAQLTADVWQTDGQTQVEDRTGYRVSLDRAWGSSGMMNLTAVDSGGQRALLAGGALSRTASQHDFGVYWFEEDLLWIDSRIGDDNAGGFYRFRGRRGPRTWMSSIELRRDGLSQVSSPRADNLFINLSLSERLTRRSHWSHVYTFRERRLSEGVDDGFTQHSLRSYLSRQHRDSSRSNFGVLLRSRDDSFELQSTYDWAKEFWGTDALELSTRYQGLYGGAAEGDELLLNVSWRKQLPRGAQLSAGVGYAYGRSDVDQNQGLQGFLNLGWPVTRGLAASLQLDYSQDRAEYRRDEELDLANEFFTNTGFEDDDLIRSRSLTAMFRLRYRLDARGGDAVLNRRPGQRGAGALRGSVFVDSNGDGVRQPGEEGLRNVTVFLDSVHPAVTDLRGDFEFAAVGPGQHFLFIEGATLPLPWVLSGKEFTPAQVELRRTSIVEIPVRPVSLADNGVEEGAQD